MTNKELHAGGGTTHTNCLIGVLFMVLSVFVALFYGFKLFRILPTEAAWFNGVMVVAALFVACGWLFVAFAAVSGAKASGKDLPI